MVTWEWSSEMQDLHDAGMQWFIQNFASKQHASLQVLAQQADGEKVMLKIHAKGDQQMYDSTKEHVANASAIRFLGIGEGKIMTDSGPQAIFILYFQDSGDPKVRSAVMPYREANGRFECGRWHETNWIKESWLPA